MNQIAPWQSSFPFAYIAFSEVGRMFCLVLTVSIFWWCDLVIQAILGGCFVNYAPFYTLLISTYEMLCYALSVREMLKILGYQIFAKWHDRCYGLLFHQLGFGFGHPLKWQPMIYLEKIFWEPKLWNHCLVGMGFSH